MPVREPSYRHHKARNLAVVTLDGKDHYLGKYNSPESREKYHRLISEWHANQGRPAAANGSPVPIQTVNDLILAYWEFAKAYRVAVAVRLPEFL
jgi:hypothetical protein